MTYPLTNSAATIIITYADFVLFQEQHSDRDPIERLNELSLECQSDRLSNPLATLEEASGTSFSARDSDPLDNAGEGKDSSEDEVTVAIRKRNYVIRELVDTEKDYVRDLKEVVDGYMAVLRDPNTELPMPEDIRGGRDKIIFGNIEAISDWHRE